METLTVEASRTYEVKIGAGLLDRAGELRHGSGTHTYGDWAIQL